METDAKKGIIKINSLEIQKSTPGVLDPNKWSGLYFKDIPITLTALPKDGYEFAGWQGVEENQSLSPTVTVIPKNSMNIAAIFAKQ